MPLPQISRTEEKRHELVQTRILCVAVWFLVVAAVAAVIVLIEPDAQVPTNWFDLRQNPNALLSPLSSAAVWKMDVPCFHS